MASPDDAGALSVLAAQGFQDDERGQREDPTSGLMSILAQPYMTTPEAQTQAKTILDRYYGPDAYKREDELLQQLRETAETSRTSLRGARDKLLGRPIDNKTKMFFDLAQQFFAPTQVGGFGENLSGAAGVLAEHAQARRQAQDEQDAGILQIDQQLAGVDQNLLQSEAGLQEIRRRSESSLAEEALKVMGRVVPTAANRPGDRAFAEIIPGNIKAKDAAFIKDVYTPWTLEGQSAEAARSIYALTEANKMLRSGRDQLTGPIVGSISTLNIPYVGDVGKVIQDVMWPAGANVREVVEENVQKSLRTILGSQFTEREGTRLIERVFNPRLEEEVIAGRVDRLIAQLTGALEEKNRASQYFDEKGTLYGYEGKQFIPEDFEPEPVMITVGMPDGGTIVVPDDSIKQDVMKLYNEKKAAAGGGPGNFAKGGRVKKFREGRIRRYAEGGSVTPYDELSGIPHLLRRPEEGEGDKGANDLLLSLVGGVGGYAAGAYGSDMGSRLEEMLRPSIPSATRAERAIMEGLDTGRESIADTGAEVKRAQRLGVPSTLLTEGGQGTRIVGERALIQGGARADQAIDELEQVHEGSRERVAERVNKSLKPYPYFDQLAKLTDELYENARPLYGALYEKYPGIPESQIPAFKQMFDSPDGQRAVKIALRILGNRGQSIGAEDAVGIVHKPSLEFLDLVKRGMDQLIFKEEDRGPTPLGKSMRELRTRLRDQLDIVTNGEYKVARMQYAGDLEVLDALQAGREQFRMIQPEELETQLKEMSTAERTAYKTGVAQSLYEMIHAPASDINAAQRLIGSPAMDRKLSMMFNKPSEARMFRSALEREVKLFQRTKRIVAKATSGRERKLTKDIEESERRTLYSPLMAVTRIFTRPGLTFSPEEADEIIDILQTGHAPEINALVARFDPLMARKEKLKGRRSKVGAVMGATGAITAPFLDEEDE